MATLRDGEVAVGAMLVSLAPGARTPPSSRCSRSTPSSVSSATSVGQLSLIAVHLVGSLGDLLRSLAHCAAGLPGETWEAVANAGTGEPVAIASARTYELRRPQPPAPGSHNAASLGGGHHRRRRARLLRRRMADPPNAPPRRSPWATPRSPKTARC